jgi:hypothetical protein
LSNTGIHQGRRGSDFIAECYSLLRNFNRDRYAIQNDNTIEWCRSKMLDMRDEFCIAEPSQVVSANTKKLKIKRRRDLAVAGVKGRRK